MVNEILFIIYKHSKNIVVLNMIEPYQKPMFFF